ncbi:GDCCVxC domain-containing (seleno)protein [Nocardioides korecus]
MSVVLHSLITCPSCGAEADETMPENACVYFYTCDGCQLRLKPKPGDCCVFCTYGTVPCPPRQAQRGKDDDDAHRC